MAEKKRVKIVTIGGGSSYTPELMEGFIKRYEELPIREIWLCDVEAGKEKLEIVGAMAQRMWDATPYDVKVHLTLNRREALPGADFSLRYGDRHINCFVIPPRLLGKNRRAWRKLAEHNAEFLPKDQDRIADRPHFGSEPRSDDRRTFAFASEDERTAFLFRALFQESQPSAARRFLAPQSLLRFFGLDPLAVILNGQGDFPLAFRADHYKHVFRESIHGVLQKID